MTDQFAIVSAQFYADIANRLLAGAQKAFVEAGCPPADKFEVSGAYELPQAASYLAKSGKYAGIACLGCVIRGETNHYDYVCEQAANGIGQVALATGVPCSFGVLTVDSYEQALERSGGGVRDSGFDAAKVILELAQLRQQLA